jgi:hypothetical protein
MKLNFLKMLLGLFFIALLAFSCETQEKKKMHAVEMEVSFYDSIPDTLNYYALLNYNKVMEFSVEQDSSLQVKIYYDSTKTSAFQKTLKRNVSNFNILRYKITNAGITSIKLD